MRLILPLALAAAVAALPAAAQTFRTPYSTPEAATEHAVRDALIDPDSAKIRIWHMIEDEDIKNNLQFITVCGEVNARNRLGGHTGYAPFRARIVKSGDQYAGLTAVIPPNDDAGHRAFFKVSPQCKRR